SKSCPRNSKPRSQTFPPPGDNLYPVSHTSQTAKQSAPNRPALTYLPISKPPQLRAITTMENTLRELPIVTKKGRRTPRQPAVFPAMPNHTAARQTPSKPPPSASHSFFSQTSSRPPA